MRARLLSICILLFVLVTPEPATAQRGPMPPSRDVAEMVSVCMSQELSESMTGTAWVEELTEGYRVVLPLRGDPIAHRNSLFPRPAENALAWIDLHRYDEPSRVPAGLVTWLRHEKFYSRRFRVEFLPQDPVYAVELGGFDWYTLGWMTVRCLDGAGASSNAVYSLRACAGQIACSVSSPRTTAVPRTPTPPPPTLLPPPRP